MNAKNQRKFAQNMVFNLAIGFHDLELTDMQKADAQGSIRKLSKYSMLIADTVLIQSGDEPPDIVTKHSVEWKDVSYFINEKNDKDIMPPQGNHYTPEQVFAPVHCFDDILQRSEGL
jgi:nucleosome binding factor SPN SPT16 subunit